MVDIGLIHLAQHEINVNTDENYRTDAPINCHQRKLWYTVINWRN